MLDERNVVRVSLTDPERALVKFHAEKAAVGGRSDIYGWGSERYENLSTNQLTAMACEAAFAKWLGPGEFDVFVRRREVQNQRPLSGDGGFDHVLPDGRKVDVTGSEAKGLLAPLAALKLCLTCARDKILEDVIYAFGVTQCPSELEPPVEVFFAGWLYGHELAGREDHLNLRGWSARGRTLHPMQDLVSGLPVEEAILARYVRIYGGASKKVPDTCFWARYDGNAELLEWHFIEACPGARASFKSPECYALPYTRWLEARRLLKFGTRSDGTPVLFTCTVKFDDGVRSVQFTREDLSTVLYDDSNVPCVLIPVERFQEW
jgi:hypothetical protein